MTVAELNFLELIPHRAKEIVDALDENNRLQTQIASALTALVAQNRPKGEYNLSFTSDEFDALYDAICVFNILVDNHTLKDYGEDVEEINKLLEKKMHSMIWDNLK